MPNSRKEKWQQRYQNASLPQPPCWLINQYPHLLPSEGRALDVACGLGGNALALAEAGLQVDAIDYADTALATLSDYANRHQLPIFTIERDLEGEGLGTLGGYQLIVVSYYLHRPLLASLAQALAPGGLLYYQTFNTARRPQRGPSSADFLLAPGELGSIYKNLEVLLEIEDLDIRGPDFALQTAFIGRKA